MQGPVINTQASAIAKQIYAYTNNGQLRYTLDYIFNMHTSEQDEINFQRNIGRNLEKLSTNTIGDVNITHDS